MQHLNYVVRWTDKDGKNHHKEYAAETAARKAKEWLLNNGASGVDIAVSIGGREYRDYGGAIPDNAQPGIEQPSFL